VDVTETEGTCYTDRAKSKALSFSNVEAPQDLCLTLFNTEDCSDIGVGQELSTGSAGRSPFSHRSRLASVTSSSS